MTASLERANVSEALKADRKEKIAMIPEELAAKKKDLLNKYRIRITLSLAGAMMVSTPAVKLLFTASVGRNRKTLSLIYNPVTKRIDPLVCDSCHQSMYQVAFDNDLCSLCLECHEKNR
jgi:CRISPR/Cas system-associated protein Csm6